MNKKQLLELVSKNVEIPYDTCRTVFDEVVDALLQQMKKGESITITGFGVFNARSRKNKEGQHPVSGKRTYIKPRIVPAFKASKTYVSLLAGTKVKTKKK
jgi:DNA-binding protein HU-beta